MPQMSKEKQPRPKGDLFTPSTAERGRLKQLREKKGYDQRELATRIGVTPATISNLETGRSKQVRKSVYASVLRVLSRKEEPAPGSDEVVRSLVEGLLELDEEQQRVVLAVVNTLKNPRDSGDR